MANKIVVACTHLVGWEIHTLDEGNCFIASDGVVYHADYALAAFETYEAASNALLKAKAVERDMRPGLIAAQTALTWVQNQIHAAAIAALKAEQ